MDEAVDEEEHLVFCVVMEDLIIDHLAQESSVMMEIQEVETDVVVPVRSKKNQYVEME
jgi:hypothetical protein